VSILKVLTATGWRKSCVLAALAAFAAGASAQQVPEVDAPPAASGTNIGVNSTFYLQAEASSCDSYPISSMAYSFSSDKDNVYSGATSLQLMVTPPADTLPNPVLRVKAWNSKGALCQTDTNLTVANNVNVSAPAQGASLTSPFTLQASASSCDSSPTSGMGYSFDTNTDTWDGNGTSINTQASASTGWHILRVKAWASSGAYCETDTHIDVTGSSGIVPPSYAQSYAHLEQDPAGPSYTCSQSAAPDHDHWLSECDSGSLQNGGSASGSNAPVSSPVYSGDTEAIQYTMNFQQTGNGERFFDGKAPQDSATYFLYDLWLYLPENQNIENIEMDMNQALSSNGYRYILAAQCSLGIDGNPSWGYWEVTNSNGWVQTNAPCNRSQITPNTWHHIQIQTHHDPYGNGNTVYYDAVAIDGNVSNITSCHKIGDPNTPESCDSAGTSSNWGGSIGPNFQLDGQTVSGYSNSITAYVDNFTVYYWTPQ
jgi:hypothetical protein